MRKYIDLTEVAPTPNALNALISPEQKRFQ